jgi:hypothetical protein
MAGKGMKPRAGYNHAAYVANYPFPERKLATEWCAELNLFPMGALPENRMTEAEFRALLAEVGHMHRVAEPETLT